jgi:dolichyl-phosphate-mannose-protein mannosyltransferase
MADIGSVSTTGASFAPDVRRRNVRTEGQARTSGLIEPDDKKQKQRVCMASSGLQDRLLIYLVANVLMSYIAQFLSLRSGRLGTSNCIDSFDSFVNVYAYVPNRPLKHRDLGRGAV